MKTKQTRLSLAIMAVVGTTAIIPAASAATLADGFYHMVINNTPYTTGYQFGTDGNWNSGFTFGALPGAASVGMYDDTAPGPVNGKYAGNPNDGVQGTVSIKVQGGVITGTGLFEFDKLNATAGGDFVEYGGSSNFTGSIDGAGNITLTPTGTLGAVSNFSALVDKAWNIGPTATAYDSFTTGTATAGPGSINGAAFDGTSAVLVKAGTVGAAWGGFNGAQYYEIWRVGFTYVACLPVVGSYDGCGGFTPPEVPIPATAWLLASGLMGLVGVSRRRRHISH